MEKLKELFEDLLNPELRAHDHKNRARLLQEASKEPFDFLEWAGMLAALVFVGTARPPTASELRHARRLSSRSSRICALPVMERYALSATSTNATPTSGQRSISSRFALCTSMMNSKRSALRSGRASRGRARRPPSNVVVSMHTPTLLMMSHTRSISVDTAFHLNRRCSHR